MMPRSRFYARHDHDYRKTGEELCRKCGQPPATQRVGFFEGLIDGVYIFNTTLTPVPVCPAHFVMKVSGLMADYERVRPAEHGEQCEPCQVEDLP